MSRIPAPAVTVMREDPTMTQPADEIRHHPVLAELDLAVLHALQVAPRAPWQLIGEVLGVDAATPARRWARLVDERLAWGTVWPTPERHAVHRDAAIVHLDCDPGAVAGVAAAAADLPWALSVDQVAGDDADLSVVVVGTGLGPLADLVHGGLAALPGVRGARIRFISVVHREDSQWRLPVLSRRQQDRLLVDSRPRDAAVPRPPREDVLDELTAALAEDVRVTVATLARRLGVAEVTARRALDRALGSARLRLGCDVAGSAVGLGRGVELEADSDHVRSAGAALAGLDAAHRLVEAISEAPLVLMARFTSLADTEALEERARTLAPGLTVRTRRTVVRTIKRNGHVLDADGRMERRLDPLL
jgi:DNA-binding Lrp family transcriptional regulator